MIFLQQEERWLHQLASISLIKKIGATPVGSACLMELKFLKGRQKIQHSIFFDNDGIQKIT